MKLSLLTLIIITCTYAQGLPTVLLVGDSLSTGYGLKEKSSWTVELRKQLNYYKRPYTLKNVSITGMTTREGAASITTWLQTYKPNITIIELGGNDALQGLQPSTIYKQLENIIVESKQYGCVALIHVPVPQHYPIDYQQIISTNSIRLAKKHKITYISTFLTHAASKNLFQDDKIHPNDEAQIHLFNSVWIHLEPILKLCHTKTNNNLSSKKTVSINYH